MEKITNPVKAIRAKCLDCCGTSNEVRLCPVEKCALHPFRFGKNPYRTKREYTPEEREAMKTRLSRFRSTTAGQGTDEAPAEGEDTTHDQNPSETLSEPYRGHKKSPLA